MKHLTIILFIVLGTLTAKAQQQEKPVMVLVPLETLKKVLEASYQLISQSNTPYKDAAPLLGQIQQLYPQLVEMKKDTAKVVPPKAKPKK